MLQASWFELLERRVLLSITPVDISTLPNVDELGPAVAAIQNGGWPKSYIVTFKDGLDVNKTAAALDRVDGLYETQRYHTAIHGEAVLVGNQEALDKLKSDPRVAGVWADGLVSADRVDSGSAQGDPTIVPPPPSQVIPVNIARVGGIENNNEAVGLTVAVMDSGIDLDHPDLVANISATLRADFVGDVTSRRQPGDDPLGHGTHVAGIIAAADNGIGVIGLASQVSLVSVRVLDAHNEGTVSTVIAGLDFVTAHANVIKVANMSLGGPGDVAAEASDHPSPMHLAVQGAVRAGVTIVAGSGNNGFAITDFNYVPATYDEVITVSAYYYAPGSPPDLDPDGDGDLGFPQFSNYGPDVDVGAPGVHILSTWKDAKYALNTGTSMATPHVSAAAAMYLAAHPNASPAQVRSAIVRNGEFGVDGSDSINPATGTPYDPEPLLNVRGRAFMLSGNTSVGAGTTVANTFSQEMFSFDQLLLVDQIASEPLA